MNDIKKTKQSAATEKPPLSILSSIEPSVKFKYIKFFEELGVKDVPIVGGKNANLGELVNHLSHKGVRIPPGFAITAEGYRHYLQHVQGQIQELLKELTHDDKSKLQQVGKQIRNLILKTDIPLDLVQEIQSAYQHMEGFFKTKDVDVAVRSSATAEDLPDASFAGQQDTILNVKGSKDLIQACREVYSSLFTDRAISYRMDKGYDHMSCALSIAVQKMVRADMASSGVIFTLDTESGFRDVLFITSAYGLGENIVQGLVNPDEFFVHKPTLDKGYIPLLKKRLGTKAVKLIYNTAAAAEKGYLSKKNDAFTINVDVPLEQQNCFSINDDEAIELAKQAHIIEQHYSDKKGSWCPMDIEWAKDADGVLYIVQARPETVHSNQKPLNYLEEYELDRSSKDKPKVLVKGKSIGRKIIGGKARIFKSINEMKNLKKGEILVTDFTDPDMEPFMRISAGIITQRGGRTCHAAIISRELGVPCIVGAENACNLITDGQFITMDCSVGEVGIVYHDQLKYSVKQTPISQIQPTNVKIMMNIGNPDEVFGLAAYPNDGIGLARLEFIINNTIRVHPMALVHYEKVTDPSDKEAIQSLLSCNPEYMADKKKYFVDKLAQEAGTIAAAFYPKPVIIRLSDFKSNEYRDLLAGHYFEPEEDNPMIGFRGASRYYDAAYRDAFELECCAMKKMRDDMGLTNAILMVPFVRTIDEAKMVIKEMENNGLKRGENGLQIYMMVEIPSNVLLIDEFSKYFDGFSIGSNDLTQMVLAVDRDSAMISHIFDERNPAVKIMLQMAIEGAKRNGKKIGICGQAPSDYPEIAQFLVEKGIDSISLSPDSLIRTKINLSKVEDQINQKQ